MGVIEAAADLDELVAAVGDSGPVVAWGSGTHQHVGGVAASEARAVRGPAGVVEHEPAEMTVRVGAGTTVAELESTLAERGQMVPLDAQADRTIGGVLGVGHAGIRRLRWGHPRDLVLQVRFVSAWGQLSAAGGPTVKNVSGYDLVKLMVGSLGTLGVMGEVVLRCVPLPAVRSWWRTEADPFELRQRLYRPSALLWDGHSTHVLLEGTAAEVEAERALLGPAEEVDGPPPLPSGGVEWRRPRELRDLGGEEGFVAEVGVGVVHRVEPVARPPLVDDRWHRAVKDHLDPAGRFAPGRRVW